MIKSMMPGTFIWKRNFAKIITFCIMQVVLVAFLLLYLPSSLYSSTARRKVIIDTDGGADDTMAIITAFRLHTDIEVVAFTTCCGNANATQAAINVLKTLRVLNKTELPVHRGCESYYTTSTDLSSDWFGNDALGDFEFPDPPTLADIKKEHGVNTLVRLTQQYPGQISLICLGPLTNIAHALKLDPNFLGNLQQLIIMGGTFRGEGNDSPGTEFNTRRDPEAASLVFQHSDQRHPVYLIPWETCLDTKITKSWRYKDLGEIASPLMTFMNKAEAVALPKYSVYWHSADPLAVLALIRPEFLTKTQTAQVYVSTEGTLGRGVMLLARRGEESVNAKIVTEVNEDLIKKFLKRAFRA